MRPTVGMTLILLSLALLTPSCARLELFRRSESLRAGTPRIGAPVPEIDGETFDGSRVKLSDQRGKVVVLVFWASWCKPCRDMIPHERELAERHRGKPFVMLGVNNDENPDAARKVIAKEKMNWPIWKTDAIAHPINSTWGVKSWPAIFVIDANGILRYTRITGQYLDNAVETLLAEMNTK